MKAFGNSFVDIVNDDATLRQINRAAYDYIFGYVNVQCPELLQRGQYDVLDELKFLQIGMLVQSLKMCKDDYELVRKVPRDDPARFIQQEHMKAGCMYTDEMLCFLFFHSTRDALLNAETDINPETNEPFTMEEKYHAWEVFKQQRHHSTDPVILRAISENTWIMRRVLELERGCRVMPHDELKENIERLLSRTVSKEA